MKISDLNLNDLHSKFIESLIENCDSEDELNEVDILYDEALLNDFNSRNINPSNFNQIIKLCDYLLIDNIHEFIFKYCEPTTSEPYKLQPELAHMFKSEVPFFMSSPKKLNVYTFGCQREIYEHVGYYCNLKFVKFLDNERNIDENDEPKGVIMGWNSKKYISNATVSPINAKSSNKECYDIFLKSKVWEVSSDSKWYALANNDLDFLNYLHKNGVKWGRFPYNLSLSKIIKLFGFEIFNHLKELNAPDFGTANILSKIISLQDISLIKQYISRHDINFDIDPYEGVDILFSAIRTNSIEIVKVIIKFLQEKSIKLNSSGYNVENLWEEAIVYGNLEIIKQIYRYLKELPSDGLFLAANHDQKEIFQYFIENNCVKKENTLRHMLFLKNKDMLHISIKNQFPNYQYYKDLVNKLDAIDRLKVNTCTYCDTENDTYKCYEGHEYQLFDQYSQDDYESDDYYKCMLCQYGYSDRYWYGCWECKDLICNKCTSEFRSKPKYHFLDFDYLQAD